MGQVFTLRYRQSSVGFMKFTVSGDTVHVHGPLGCATYIDRTMPISEAREYWKELVSQNWRRCQNSDAPHGRFWFWN
jgi:hypothetical protein